MQMLWLFCFLFLIMKCWFQRQNLQLLGGLPGHQKFSTSDKKKFSSFTVSEFIPLTYPNPFHQLLTRFHKFTQNKNSHVYFPLHPILFAILLLIYLLIQRPIHFHHRILTEKSISRSWPCLYDHLECILCSQRHKFSENKFLILLID